jgi:5-(carboxyamino)imidazole ribonucleotide mutase
MNTKNTKDTNKQIQVAVVMGSQSDWETMRHACDILKEFGIEFSAQVLSAHRMPLQMNAFAKNAQQNGLKAIIAGAGGAAHLPGMIAAQTIVPVFGVPVASKHLQGVDSLHSIVQMPKGIPVACFAIGVAGAANSALQVVAMLAMFDEDLAQKLNIFREKQTEMASNMILPVDE